jgi:undecaprenyl-diphosphatase
MANALIVFFARWLFFIMVGGVIGWLVKTKKSWRQIVTVAAPPIVNWAVVLNGLHALIHDPRPFVALHTTPLVWVNQGEWNTSFPSGHAIFLFSLATAVWFFDRKFGGALFVLSALVGVARVLALAHWPIDIVVGAALGIILTRLEIWFLNKRISLH